MGHILKCALALLMLSRALASVEESFESNDVVPNVVPVAPQALCSVKYPSGAEVEEGNVLTPTQVKDDPTVTWQAESDSFYTLAIVDPDAPSRATPLLRELLHGLVVNIKGNDVASGDARAAYLSPTPSPGSGLHRYVFLVYKQPEELEFDEPILPILPAENRAGFSIAKFAKKYNLGDPIAGNFFQAASDGLLVKYPSGAEVKEGNVLSPIQVVNVPTVKWQAEPDTFYTLAMVDPDVPSRGKPLLRELLHWLVVNIKFNNVASGEVRAIYLSPTPPPLTDRHRYVFLVYKQPKYLKFDEPILLNLSIETRVRFSIAKFAKKYNLGDPTDGNFFQAGFNDLLQDDLSKQPCA